LKKEEREKTNIATIPTIDFSNKSFLKKEQREKTNIATIPTIIISRKQK
jgi:hypothetical protein